MRFHLWALVGTTVLTTAALQLPPGGPFPAESAEPASLAVEGGARIYPAYDPAITRYAVFPAADGSVRVEVAGGGPVWFNGAPDADGTATITGLTAGEEISVFLGDGADRRALALYVVPTGFPTLQAELTYAPLTPGNIALTLDRFDNRSSPRFEAVVDRNGVPAYTRSHLDRVLDLKLAANGHYTVHRPTNSPNRTGGALVELDDQFREVRRIETSGLVNTDDHDSRLYPDGSRWLLAYEPNTATGLVDSVIQHVAPDGGVIWQWTSAPYADETVVPGDADYAHINAIDVQPNGDVLASFRNFSSVFLIRPGADPVTEVVWKLGGRDSDFAFPALPGGSTDVGVCAQHSATIVGNGNVLVFDNGSSAFFGRPLCVDQRDPQGSSVYRPTTRIVEFALSGGIATPVNIFGDTDQLAWFMGSAAKFASGNVLIGWSSASHAIATETDAAGETIWRLRDTVRPEDGVTPKNYISYRAALVPVRDGFDPEVSLGAPADGTTVTQGSEVVVDFSCSDRGGSTLQACDGPAGRRLDTAAPGAHTWSVTGRDGSGRTTTLSRSYTVVAPATVPPLKRPATPDLSVRARRSPWVGVGVSYPSTQDAKARVRPGRIARATVRVANTGQAPGRFLLRARTSLTTWGIKVTYTQGGTDRTRPLRRRGWRTPTLLPGETLRVVLRAKVRTSARAGSGAVRVSATSPAGKDRVRLRLRVLTRVT